MASYFFRPERITCRDFLSTQHAAVCDLYCWARIIFCSSLSLLNIYRATYTSARTVPTRVVRPHAACTSVILAPRLKKSRNVSRTNGFRTRCNCFFFLLIFMYTWEIVVDYNSYVFGRKQRTVRVYSILLSLNTMSSTFRVRLSLHYCYYDITIGL